MTANPSGPHRLGPWLLAALPLAWLLPNHYPPWDSAWQEGAAIAALVGAALFGRGRGRATLPVPWALAAAIAILSIAGQLATGRILFTGDAVMAGLYVGLFVVALAVGHTLAAPLVGGLSQPPSWRNDSPSVFATGLVLAAAVSVGIALVQWTDVAVARAWIFDLPATARPFSNLGQPNHFDTAAFLGLVSLALLRDAGHIGRAGFWSGAAFMLAGMVMSGSRTAWVQLIVFAVAALWPRRAARASARVGRVGGVIALYAALSVLWGLQSGHGRTGAELMSAGTRPAAWRDAVAAIAHEPLWGFGWQQMSLAQQSVALQRPSYLEHIAHAHNIALDLLVWAGIPVGGLILLLMLLALADQGRRLSEPRSIWLFAGAMGVLAHGLLEYPLEYAYFLLPFGVCLGMTHALAPSPRAMNLPSWTILGAAAVLATVSLLVARDYLVAEDNFRLMRLETARIGTQGVQPDTPDLLVLDQLEALLAVVRSESKAGMSSSDLARLDKVSRRYGMPGLQVRLALAQALNGRPHEAAATLRVLCQVHGPARCDKVREAWLVQQQTAPALRDVPLP